MNRHRYVFDTNTIISGFLFDRSTPGEALKRARHSGQLLLSIETAGELSEVLERDKFDRYVRKETRREFLVLLLEEASFVEVSEQLVVCRDPKDNKFLELAVAGNATAIISGDDDLLSLQAFRGILILTAKEFLQRLEQNNI